MSNSTRSQRSPAPPRSSSPASGLTTTSSAMASSSEAYIQPPFPQPGTATHKDSGSSQARGGAENLINATAKHVFPASPKSAPDSPPVEEGGETSQAAESQPEWEATSSPESVTSRAKRKEKMKSDRAQREEEPLIGGTPLDEMTPGEIPSGSTAGFPFGRQSSYSNRRRQEKGREDCGDTLRHRVLSSTAIPEDQELGPEEMLGGMGGVDAGMSMQRPGFGASREIGSVRMGASALVSALNALPWDGDDEGEQSSENGSEDEEPPDSAPLTTQEGLAAESQRVSRPKMNRLGSSLHTIRPMQLPGAGDALNSDNEIVEVSPITPRRPHQSLHFPFRQNTIARHAQSPGLQELSYQFAAAGAPPFVAGPPVNEAATSSASPIPPISDTRRVSTESSGSSASYSSLPPSAQQALNERVTAEEHQAEKEEDEEILRTVPPPARHELSPILDKEEQPSDLNTAAALREGKDEEAIEVEDRMAPTAGERQLMRREKLAQKLLEVFGLKEMEEVLEEMRCWLLRSVMLKGYMYLTHRHICFFAHMPDRADTVVKTGPLHKKSSRMKMNTKYWVMLKKDVLSWYESTSDPYFPKGNVSLQYASSCDAIDEVRFKLRTPERNYTFIAETEAARDEWVKAIQKAMFKVQHEGESVKLIIPLEAVLDIEKTPTLEFADTIEIRCVDPEDQMSVDSYFFASFQDTEHALNSIQTLLNARPETALPRFSGEYVTAADGAEEEARQRKTSDQTVIGAAAAGLKKVGSVFKPLVSRDSDKDAASHDTATEAKEAERGSVLGLKLPRRSQEFSSSETLRPEDNDDLDGSRYDGYPPRQSGPPPAGHHSGDDTGKWSGWLKKPVTKVLGSAPSLSSLHRSSSSRSSLTPAKSPKYTSQSLTKSPYLQPVRSPESMKSPPSQPLDKPEAVTEVVEPVVPDSDSDDSDTDYSSSVQDPHSPSTPGQKRSRRRSRRSFHSSREFSVIEGDEEEREDAATADKFRSVFSLPAEEELIDHFPGYLYRVLPVSGRFFVSTNYFCFRSSQLLYKTKMIIPIRDLYGLKAQKAFRFGHSGLVVVIKGHEEIFLEFSSSRRRKACIAILEERMEVVRLRQRSSQPSSPQIPNDTLRTRIMEDLDESSPIEARSPGVAGPVSPSPMFGSTTSTFLEFKPEPMKITCLTIGSRGDVQPYIALCKGLQAEGHSTRIATHGEYKAWVEGHGIEFASVGGDPAELMQMCVDNGMFTVSFLKEGLQKFRGWLDDLLNSSWEACQGSDLLIESPSAMGGIHIAEALRIPYYRAFTMPWTRTRAYPHAFAVPDHVRGGSYNYMTYTMFDQVFWRAISGQINRWRKHVMGIESTTFDKLEQHKVPFLYNFSPSIVPPPLDWTEWIHVTGYWFLENADENAAKKKWSPPEGLLEFIDKARGSGKKVVYIGFGSIVVSDPEEMTRCVVDAVLQSGVCAILSKGWSDRGSKAKGENEDTKEGADGIKYPPEIFAIDSIDHSWLFTRIDAAVHHGGAGTTGASLRAGIPTIIKPFFGDQAFWSERVETRNVGSAVRKLTAESLAEALKKATTDEKQIYNAKIVGEMIRKENGVARAIEAIYRDLEYAKSLIKRPSTSASDKEPSRVSSILSPITSRDLPSLSNLSLSRTSSKGQNGGKGKKSRPSSFSAPRRPLMPHAEGPGDLQHQASVSEDNVAIVSPRPHGQSESTSREVSTDREGGREHGSDGSWSVLSGSEERPKEEVQA